MEKINKKAMVAIVLLVLAGLLVLWDMGALSAAPGKHVEAIVVCPKCGARSETTFADVIKHGQLREGSGWQAKCPKCGTWSPARSPDALAKGDATLKTHDH